MGLMIEAIGSLGASLLAIEISARVPKLSRWLIELSVRQLPQSEQARWREEWRAHHDDLPNSLAKLLHPLSLALGGAAGKISANWSEDQMPKIGSQLTELRQDSQLFRRQVDGIYLQITETLPDALRASREQSLEVAEDILLKSRVAGKIKDTIRSNLHNHLDNVTTKVIRSRDAYGKLVAVMFRRLDEVDKELLTATAAYERAATLMNGRRGSHTALAGALTELVTCLGRARVTLGPSEQENALRAESSRLADAAMEGTKVPDLMPTPAARSRRPRARRRS